MFGWRDTSHNGSVVRPSNSGVYRHHGSCHNSLFREFAQSWNGELGSSRAYAGNPSKLITTTVLSLRTFVSARRDPDAAYIINARVHRGDKSPTSLLNEILPYFSVANCESQLSAKNKTKAHIVAAPHDVVCSPGIIEEIAVNTSRQIGLAF